MKKLLAVVVVLLGLVTAHALAAGSEEELHRCHGRRATIVGTVGDDVLRGTPGRDVIWGGPGSDTIYASLGNDLVCGGAGDDVIHGGRGNDEVFGGRGADRVFGDLGDDKVSGGAGDYDDVAGGLGIDTVNGGPGNYDLVHGDYGYDLMSGGPGKHDIASFATAVAGGKGTGIWASLRKHVARGDGHDRLFGFEDLEGSAFRDTLIGDGGPNEIDGGPGDDTLIGGGGRDTLDGGQGSDGCRGAPGRTVSCGHEAPPVGSAYVQVDEAPNGGGGVQIVGGAGRDDLAVSFDGATETLSVKTAAPLEAGDKVAQAPSAEAGARLAAGPGCVHPTDVPASFALRRVECPLDGPARWLMADLGPGDDRFVVEGSLVAVGSVRVNGGDGDDVIRGGPEDDLFESGPGADRLYGGAGADGLVGGIPGPTFLYGGPDGDLLAAGGGCAGGALVGGPGRDDASFSEVGTHPGVLTVSFPAHKAWIESVPGCHPVHLSPTDEDMEGSFGPDILIGNGRANAMLGQPGKDVFIGNGGDDVIDARDGAKDTSIQCGRGHPRVPAVPKTKSHKRIPPVPATGRPEGRALVDPQDPSPTQCAKVVQGRPVPGLHG